MIVDHELLVQWAFSRAGAAARLVMRDWRRCALLGWLRCECRTKTLRHCLVLLALTVKSPPRAAVHLVVSRSCGSPGCAAVRLPIAVNRIGRSQSPQAVGFLAWVARLVMRDLVAVCSSGIARV